MLRYWDKLFEGGAYSDEEYRLLAKDGQIKWATATWGPILDDGGRQIGVQGSEREITERKLAEERFRQLAENLDQVFWMLDIGTNKVLYVSPAFEKVWGRSPGALYQDRDWLLETVHPEDRDRFAAFLARIASGPAEEYYRIVRPDGTVCGGSTTARLSCAIRKESHTVWRELRRTSQPNGSSKSSSATPTRWRRWEGWREASLTISITCSRLSAAIRRCWWKAPVPEIQDETSWNRF